MAVSKLTEADIDSLKAIVTGGLRPPTFHTATWSMDSRAAMAKHILESHGIDLDLNEATGQLVEEAA